MRNKRGILIGLSVFLYKLIQYELGTIITGLVYEKVMQLILPLWKAPSVPLQNSVSGH